MQEVEYKSTFMKVCILISHQQTIIISSISLILKNDDVIFCMELN